MAEPRYRRRKEDRPREITEAAFEAFAEKGYAATRVEEVAQRAGISKGLMYRYFETKEELFQAVIKTVVVSRFDALAATLQAEPDASCEAFLRGPVLEFLKQVPGSRVSVVIRLLMAEGKRHPDLVDYYYENVVARGLGLIDEFLERGVERGEFRATAVNDFPHLFIAPMVVGMLFKVLFTKRSLDTDKLIDTQFDLLLAHIRA